MKRTDLYLRDQTEIKDSIEALLTDTSNALATDAQYYQAINRAIQLWAGRVMLPRIYELSGGVTAGTYEYTLPSHIRPPFTIQIKTPIYGPWGVISSDDDTTTWQDIAGYSVEPTSTGGYKIRLQSYPYTEDARLIWYSENSPVPATIATLTNTIDSDDTTLVVGTAGTFNGIALDNLFIKIESEWLSCQNVTRTSNTSLTLNGCVRGLYGTTAASHNSTTSVLWGVAVDDQRLWVQLDDQATAHLHTLQLHKATGEDMNRHEKLMSYFQTKADNFWRQAGYVSNRVGKMNMQAGGVGFFTW